MARFKTLHVAARITFAISRYASECRRELVLLLNSYHRVVLEDHRIELQGPDCLVVHRLLQADQHDNDRRI